MSAPAVAQHVDDDVLVEGIAVLEGQVRAADDGLGVVGVDVQDGDLQALGQVRRVTGGTALRGSRREADLVVDHDVDRAAGLVALQLGQVEGLLDDPLADERSVTVDEDRDDRQIGVSQVLLLGAHDALQDAVRRLQVRGVGGHVDLGGQAVVEGVDAPRSQVVLDVSRALHRVGHVVALELVENLRVGLARNVGQDVEAPAVGHADRDLVDARASRVRQDVVQQRDQGFPALKGEALLAHELGLQELLECLGANERAQDVALGGGGERLVRSLDAFLDPGALVGILDVHVLDADGSRVGVVQPGQDVAQQHLVRPAEASRGEGTVQVPHAEPVGGDVQVGVAADAVGQRVGVGRQVAARAVGVDDLRDACGLALLPVRVVLVVRLPRVGAGGHVQGGEDALVEAVAPGELGVHEAEQAPGGRPLDDAVVVGGGEVHRLADAQRGQALGGHAAELGRIVGGSDADDESLPDHEAGHGGRRAQGSRVGQRDRRPLEVCGRQRGGARPRHEVLVGVNELGEGQGVGVVNDGDLQRVVPRRVRHVDGQAQADVRQVFERGLAVLQRVPDVQVGHLAQRLDEGVADEVREGHLAADRACQVGVDEGAVLDEELGGNLALGRGGGDRQGGVHVLRGGARGGLQDAGFVLGGGGVGEREGGAPVLLPGVGAGCLGEGDRRRGRQVRARDGDDGGRVCRRRGLLVLFDVEGGGRDRDRRGVLGGGAAPGGARLPGGRGLVGGTRISVGNRGTRRAQLRGSRLGGKVGAPRGVKHLGVALVEVTHLREIPLRIGLGSCGGGHVFLRLRHAERRNLPARQVAPILPPSDNLHDTLSRLGEDFTGLWSH